MTPRVQRLTDTIYRIGPLGNPRVLSSYLICDEKVGIVDCGPASISDDLYRGVSECGLSPGEIDYLLLTHIHLDHAGGSLKFLQKFPASTVFVPERGFKHLADPAILNSSSRAVLGERIFNSWGPCGPVPREKLRSVKPHEIISLGKVSLEYFPATGHAPHHCVLIDNQNSVVFSADGLGIFDEDSKSIIPTSPPPSFDLSQAIEDIGHIANLKTRLCCLAHFCELTPTASYFDSVLGVYKVWSEIIEAYLKDHQNTEFDVAHYGDIFERLVTTYPEYRGLSFDLVEQVKRVDISGMLNYFWRKEKASASVGS